MSPPRKLGVDMRFEAVRLVVLESNRQVRQALIAHLFHHGFRDIVETDRLSDVEERLTKDSVDLLIASVQGDADQTVATVLRKVRHQEIGDNPFILATLLTTNTAFDSVNALLNTGPDDVLIAPTSVGAIYRRIMTRVQMRKPFIVTSEYIGPDRRNERLPNSGDEHVLVSVPNPLRAKATGEGLNDLAKQCLQTKRIINGMSVECAAQQIVSAGSRLPTLSHNQDDRPAVVSDFNRLTTSLANLRRVIPGTAYEDLESPAGRLADALGALGADPTLGTTGARKNIESLSKALFHAMEDLRKKATAGR